MTLSDSERVAGLRARLANSSLRGSTRDGEIALDASGHVRADGGLRRRFDWYLTLIGEFSHADIRALLLADVQQELGGQAALETADWYDRYVGLHEELARSDVSGDPAAQLAQLQVVRHRWLGAAADAMYGEEEAETAYTLQRQALLNDNRLDPATRAARLAELEARRPAQARLSEREATSAQLVGEQSQQFEQLGIDAETRHRERAALWGDDAADRLAALDHERVEWNRRLAAFAQSRERILANPNLDANARQRALRDLLQRDFAANERIRVEALAAAGALPQGD